jgi:GH15 family glucan-1,4-alpha-glucosidase
MRRREGGDALSNLDLGLIGNCNIGALIDDKGEIVWACLPRPDGDPVFCSLLRERRHDGDFGFAAVDLLDFTEAQQEYLDNTAILVTRLYDRHGGAVEIQDFAPRFRQYGRMFRPMMLVRRIRPLAGNPRVVLRVRPAHAYGRHQPEVTFGSHHIRYVAPELALRLTTDASVTAIARETPFFLEDAVTLILGPDETVTESTAEVGRHFMEQTAAYWREWVRYLSIPFEWQDAVIRAAITLKLNAYDDTGAIVAAMTTSIPEAADSGRNWDYRYCWVRDGYFVINALNRLGTTHTMERYLSYIVNVAAGGKDGHLQPVYRIDGHGSLEEREETALPGYRGMGPVRVGNQAYLQVQHDVYGSAVLAATHVFYDRRLAREGDEALFRRLEPLGEQAVKNFDRPDAGLWELRLAATVAAVEKDLKRGDYVFRYVEADDFGVPQNAFLVCTFWYIYALVALKRTDEARALFEKLLARRNRHGLLAEHVAPASGEQWGNFPQTYSMVGLINCAIRLSLRWDQAF